MRYQRHAEEFEQEMADQFVILDVEDANGIDSVACEVCGEFVSPHAADEANGEMVCFECLHQSPFEILELPATFASRYGRSQ